MSDLDNLVRRCLKRDPNFGSKAIFDVGANKGQSTRLFYSMFEQADVHCFEPAPETFERLRANIPPGARLYLNNCGLGRAPGKVRFTQGLDTGNHQVLDSGTQSGAVIEVDIKTGDRYCRDGNIPEIDYLKIDTEGFDLDVLIGFSQMLAEGRISNIQVECSTNLDNRFHVHLERFIHFLHPFNYRLSDIINPVHRIHKTKQPMNGIWYCDAVFAREIDNPRLRRDGRN